jgi:ABC-type sugar transport system ATPase subunit
VFLLDEPLSNLDAKLRGELRAELKRLHQRVGTTMIFVTHDQVEAMTLGDRIAVMDRGVLQQLGPPEDVYDRPRNLFVARFVGSPAMNLLPGPTVGLPEGVTAGIRAEALHPAGEHDDQVRLEMVVEVVEPLGSDVFVHGTAAGEPVVARLPGGSKVEQGERLELAAERDRVHRFDTASGERLEAAPVS